MFDADWGRFASYSLDEAGKLLQSTSGARRPPCEEAAPPHAEAEPPPKQQGSGPSGSSPPPPRPPASAGAGTGPSVTAPSSGAILVPEDREADLRKLCAREVKVPVRELGLVPSARV